MSQLSQEEAAKIHAARQTIPNREMGKNYPDLCSLALLRSRFSVPLATLIKGDPDKIKEQVQIQKQKKATTSKRTARASLLLRRLRRTKLSAAQARKNEEALCPLQTQ